MNNPSPQFDSGHFSEQKEKQSEKNMMWNTKKGLQKSLYGIQILI